jgi:N-acetylglucosaminyl-diphospho-decaprenol L-rhamnosyltransferase
MADIAVIVLNWNGGRLAVDSVGSFVAQTVEADVWVIDNGSTDGSCEAIARACPQARMIRNDRNRGYAPAVNQGLAAAGPARYVVLANNDIILRDRQSIERVVAYMDAHPDVHGVCGRYEYPDGRFQRFYTQLPTEFDMIVTWGVGRHLHALLQAPRSREYYLADRDFDRPMTLEQPAFSCVLMRGDTLRRVGWLDEQFTIFFNDVDYCWRWRQHGLTWHYLPEWRIVHDQSSATRRLPLLSAELAGSAVRFANKSFTGASRWRIRTAIVLEAAWRKLLHRDFPVSLASIWRGELFHVDAAPPPAAATAMTEPR